MLNKNKLKGGMPKVVKTFKGRWLFISLALMIFTLATVDCFFLQTSSERPGLMLLFSYGTATGLAWYAGKDL